MAELQHSDLFSGKTGLSFQRNLIVSLSDFGSQISKEFEEHTGVPVKCEFINRAMGAMKIRFKPLISIKSGEMDFEKTMQSFITDRLNYINSYVNAAVRASLGKSALAESRAIDNPKGDTSQWMGVSQG